MKKYLRCLLVIFVFMTLFDWAIQWVLSTAEFSSSLPIWRPSTIISAKFPIFLAGSFLSAFFFCLLLARSDSTSMQDFLVFGTILGCLLAGVHVVLYSIWQVSMSVALVYMLLNIFKYISSAAIFSTIAD